MSIGALSNYSGGFTLPEGLYALKFLVHMFTPTKSDGSPAGAARLGVTLTCAPINEEGERVADDVDQFISLGTKAHESWAPDPETGGGVVAIPGGKGVALNNQSNWFYFWKSLYDAGMPEGFVDNDLHVLDGIRVRTANVPEPESRKRLQAATGEAAMMGGGQEKKGSGVMVTVLEVLDGGKPWEEAVEFPEEENAKPKKKAAVKAPVKPVAKPAVAAKPGPKAVVKPKAAPAAEETEGISEEVADVAQAAFAELFADAKYEDGLKVIMARTKIFTAVKAEHGDEMAQQMVSVFDNEEALSTVLGALGYSVNGKDIVRG